MTEGNNRTTDRLIGELTGQVKTLIDTYKVIQTVCERQGRHDERIGALERFRAGVWAVGLVVVAAVLKLAVTVFSGGGPQK